MDESSKKVFKDSLETIYMYFTYLHLGYFYSQLSKHKDLSSETKNIVIDSDTGKYLLRRDIILNSLSDMYKKSSLQDFFSYLILIDSIRGITNALVEALNDNEIKNLFLRQIFRKDEEAYNNFDGIVRFIRNTFSHNIRDRLELKNEDYKKQVNYLKGKGKSTLNFFFDYSNSPIPIKHKNYTVEIHIDFNKIKDGDAFLNIISEYQSLMFTELCSNCMEYLKDRLD